MNRADAISGVLVADAAAMGLHWLYDQEHIKLVERTGDDFNADCGITSGFGVTVFLNTGGAVYRTYSTQPARAQRYNCSSSHSAVISSSWRS